MEMRVIIVIDDFTITDLLSELLDLFLSYSVGCLEVVGKGGWGEVRVAKFRDLRIAAKFLYDVILSDYNRRQFVREMTIAAKLILTSCYLSELQGKDKPSPNNPSRHQQCQCSS